MANETVQMQISVGCKQSECESGTMDFILELNEPGNVSFVNSNGFNLKSVFCNNEVNGTIWYCPDCEEPHSEIEIFKRILQTIIGAMD